MAGSGDKEIRLLRIYSQEIERRYCPGPYQNSSIFEETAVENYDIPQHAQQFALHYLIDSKVELEQTFHCSNLEVPSPERRSEYRQLVAKAESQVILEGRFDIVLCTLSETSSVRIQRHFTPIQCIVYEASLATEPETAAAIARSSHQVILMGDHSSGHPPVWSKVARRAGLNVSLFERYVCQLKEDDKYGLYIFLEEHPRMVS